MKPAGENVLQKWPVSKRITSSKTAGDDASLIDRSIRHIESNFLPRKKVRQKSPF